MSEIDKKYSQVINANLWIGEPAGPEQTCGDKIGSFREYQGGASIYYTPATGAHLIYGLIRAKWIALGREKGPNGYPTTDEADAGSGKGRYNNFQHGTIIWKQGTSEAFAVYGAIYEKWGTFKYDMGPLGFPLTDESATDIGSGRYNDFEHGAIYYHASTGTHVVRSPILEAWSFADREKGLLKFPTSDTPAAPDDQNTYTQAFQGGNISCKGTASRAIVASSIVMPRIEPRTRSLILDANPKYVDAWRLPNIDDTRVCKLTRLNRHFRLKTVLVIFHGSYTRTLSDPEIEDLKSCYATAHAKIHDFNFGLGGTENTVVVADPALNLKKTDFVDFAGDKDPDTFQAEFSAYSKVIAALQAEKLSVDDFDVVLISIPWEDTATNKASGLAWANTSFKLGNSKTWSTIHYIYPGPYWWAYYVHETTHCIEWMLQNHGYPHLRNNDDPWWGACYPTLTASSVVPPPENLDQTSDPRLYAMHQRIKASWFGLHPKWGYIETSGTSLENYGKILMYSCPDSQTIVESAWITKYLDISPTDSECQEIAIEVNALNNEKKALQKQLDDLDFGPGGKAELVGKIKKINQKLAALNEKVSSCNAKATLANK